MLSFGPLLTHHDTIPILKWSWLYHFTTLCSCIKQSFAMALVQSLFHTFFVSFSNICLWKVWLCHFCNPLTLFLICTKSFLFRFSCILTIGIHPAQLFLPSVFLCWSNFGEYVVLGFCNYQNTSSTALWFLPFWNFPHFGKITVLVFFPIIETSIHWRSHFFLLAIHLLLGLW